MATTKELLQLVITADGKGAIDSLEGVGASARKNLGEAEDRLARVGAKMTAFGTAAIAGSVVVAGALYKAAQGFEEAEQNQRKFDNSVKNSNQTFRNGGKDLADYAQSLQQITTADGDAVVGMQALLIQFGLTEQQVKTLTPLVVDLSQKMGISLDDAAKAVGKATQGSVGGLKRYGIEIDSAKAKTDAFGAVVEGLQSTVGGFAEAEAKTFTGQIEIMKHNLGDIAESVGKGAVEVFGGLTSGAADLSRNLSQSNPQMLEAVGKAAAIGTAGLAGAGGIAVLVGKFLELRQNLTDANGQLTRTGQAVRGLAVAGAVVGGVIALDGALRSLTESSGSVEKNINDLKAATDRSGSIDALIEQTRELDGGWDDIKQTFNTIGDLGQYVNLDGVNVDINNLDESLSQLVESGDWETLRKTLTALEQSRVREGQGDWFGGTGGPEGLDNYNKIINDYARQLESADAAQVTVARSQAIVGEETDSTADKMSALSDVLSAYGARLKLLDVDQNAAAAGAKAFSAALESTTTADDMVEAAVKYQRATKDIFAVEGIAGLPRELDTAKAALGQYTDQQMDALASLSSASSAVGDYIGSLVAAKRPTEEVTAAAQSLWQQYEQQFVQVGMTSEQMRRYQEILGLTPEQVNTAVILSGAEEARQKLQLLQAFIQSAFQGADEFGRSKIEMAVSAKVAEGDLAGAAALYSAWVADIQNQAIEDPIVQAVVGDTTPATEGIALWKVGQAGAPPTSVPVGANTAPADAEVEKWRAKTASKPVVVRVEGRPTVSLWDALTGRVRGGTGGGGGGGGSWASGGFVSDKHALRHPPAALGTDTVPAWLTPGEFVITKEAAKRIGYGQLEALNRQRFATGGAVPPVPAVPAATTPVGGVSDNSTHLTVIQHGVAANASPRELVRAQQRAKALLG